MRALDFSDLLGGREGRSAGSAFAAVAGAHLCVLGSGSRGNCAVLRVSAHGRQRLILIDIGLSPRLTSKRLNQLGLDMADCSAVLLTHLDRDHCHDGFCGAPSEALPLPAHCEVFVPKASLGRAQEFGLNGGRVHAFDRHFRTRCGVDVTPLMQYHDALGAAAFKITLPSGVLGDGAEACPVRRTIGFATDLGRVTGDLIALLRAVHVLAIESNYCPERQASSDRPDFLKRRITGGRGHLSNLECLDAIHAIEPREHVVLLHLSRDCNCPQAVAALHEGADYALTIALQDEPTRWVRV
ncbi:MBL fold metallo-hydrolase [soil metagenome]